MVNSLNFTRKVTKIHEVQGALSQTPLPEFAILVSQVFCKHDFFSTFRSLPREKGNTSYHPFDGSESKIYFGITFGNTYREIQVRSNKGHRQ